MQFEIFLMNCEMCIFNPSGTPLPSSEFVSALPHRSFSREKQPCPAFFKSGSAGPPLFSVADLVHLVRSRSPFCLRGALGEQTEAPPAHGGVLTDGLSPQRTQNLTLARANSASEATSDPRSQWQREIACTCVGEREIERESVRECERERVSEGVRG